jgi:hypothetical protein
MIVAVNLVDLQLDTQNSYLFTYNTFIKILYMFQALRITPWATQYTRNLIISEEFYLKFYYYQILLIINTANYNTVILDNSLFTQ